jgi:carbonic anhydrase
MWVTGLNVRAASVEQSEPTIAGEHCWLELHLVHQDSDGRIAGVGVLSGSGAESKLLAEVWARWPRRSAARTSCASRSTRAGCCRRPGWCFGYTYTGSLTTPSEGVMWNMMRRAMSDSKAHLDELARHHTHNDRELPPLGDRKIL